MTGFLRQIRMREEPERPEAIVEGDDHRTFGGEVLAVIPGQAARPSSETAAIDPHHDRPLVVRRAGAGPDVGVQTVLAACRLARRRRGRRLHGSGATSTATATAANGRAGRARRAKGV